MEKKLASKVRDIIHLAPSLISIDFNFILTFFLFANYIGHFVTIYVTLSNIGQYRTVSKILDKYRT